LRLSKAKHGIAALYVRLCQQTEQKLKQQTQAAVPSKIQQPIAAAAHCAEALPCSSCFDHGGGHLDA